MSSLAERLLDAFLGLHPSEASRTLGELELSSAGAILDRVSPASAARALSETATRDIGPMLAAMSSGSPGRVLELMPRGTAVAALAALDPADRERVIAALPEREARGFRRQLEFRRNAVGSLMEPARNVVQRHLSLASAREAMARNPVSYLYVVDPSGVLVGVVAPSDLERPGSSAGDVMVRDFHTVGPAMSVDLARQLPAWSEVEMLPVVDQAGVLIGRLRHKQLRRSEEADTGARTGPAGAGLDPVVGLTETYCSRLWEVIGALADASQGPRNEPGHQENPS